jgi:hypothetical protein
MKIAWYCLDSLQQKLIHSYIAEKNNYKAFVNSQKDLSLYLNRIAEENNLKRE